MKPIHLPELIEGPRVVLKRHRAEVISAMFDLVDEDRERLKQNLPWVKWTKGRDDVRDYIEMTISRWEESTLFDYGLFLKDTNEYVGNVGAYGLDWTNASCELGYWIGARFEGKGYISEGLSLLERAAFGAGFFRIELRCTANNLRSASVAQRNGYVQEGRLRLNKIEHGVRHDTLIFSKLKHD